MGKLKNDIQRLRDRRQRVLDGKYNCIPFPFQRFRRLFPGIEQEKFLVITANQKIGKSKFTDYVLVYEPLFFSMEHPELKVKILYFTLEMSPSAKRDEFYCHLLYRLDNIRISPTDLRSTDQERPVDEKVLELLESERYKPYIDKFNEMVEFIDDDKNPTGINKRCRDYALSHGHLNFKEVDVVDPLDDSKITKRRVVDSDNPYTPDDPEEYRIVIVDNASNLALESGMKKMENIDKLAKYGIILRNQLKYIFVLIQHQAQAQEGIENQKLNKIKPSSDGLADCKTTTRDANFVLGLYSPYKYGLREYEGYDITKFGNFIRFMEVIEDRDYGASNNICPLFFDGAASTFAELPRADDKEGLERVYTYIQTLKQPKKKGVSFFIKSIKSLLNKKNG